MSRRNKLLKFQQISGYPNVYENFSVRNPKLIATGDMPVELIGRWREEHFKNDFPITLELACGRGEYTVALGKMFPIRNFIGVDIKGARIWKGATQAIEANLQNVAFLRTRIECLDAFFKSGEVDEIWITFPDPFPRERQANRRLTSPFFLRKYAHILKPGGAVHLKTDNTGLFMYTIDVLTTLSMFKLEVVCDDIDAMGDQSAELGIQTHYEQVHRKEGAKIKYLRFTA